MNSAQRTLDFAVDNERAVGDENGVVLRPNWNADGESIVYEVKDEDGSKLCFVRSDGSVSVPLAVCNEGASHVQGRAAFFAQDDFAFVSDPGGRLAIWRCELQAQRVSQLIAPRRVLATKAPVRREGIRAISCSFAPSRDRRLLMSGRPASAVPTALPHSTRRWATSPGSFPERTPSCSIRIATAPTPCIGSLRSLPPRQSGSARRTPARRTPRHFRRRTSSTSRSRAASTA